MPSLKEQTRSRNTWLTSTESGFLTDNHCWNWRSNHVQEIRQCPLELPTLMLMAIRKLTPRVTQILGRIIIDGEFSGRTIVLRIAGKIGEASGITIRVPPAWDYSSCLGAMSSDILDTDTRGHSHLDDLMVGLIGAEITLFRINPTNVILEFGSIRIEKRLSNREDLFQIEDHDHKKGYRIGQGSCVEESL